MQVDNPTKLFGLVFDDEQKILFIKKWPWKNCQVHKYSEISGDHWYENNGVINKGHPYLGAIAGNAIGGFGTGMAGAMIGQQMPGREVEYLFNPTVDIWFKNGSYYTCQLAPGKTKKNSLSGRLLRDEMEKLAELLDHAQGRPTPEEYMGELRQ